MNALNNLSFRTKLTLPILIIAVILLIIALLGISVSRSLTASAERLGHRYLPAVDVLIQADRDLYQAQVAERSLVFMGRNSSDYAALIQQHEENIGQALERVNRFASLMDDAEVQALVSQFRNRFQTWQATTRSIVGQAGSNAAALSFGRGAQEFGAMRDLLDQLTEMTELEADRQVAGAERLSSRGIGLQLAALAFGLLVCLLLAWQFPRVVTRPLKQILARIVDIGQGDGDLTARVGLERRDELGQLARGWTTSSPSCRASSARPRVLRPRSRSRPNSSRASPKRRPATCATSTVRSIRWPPPSTRCPRRYSRLRKVPARPPSPPARPTGIQAVASRSSTRRSMPSPSWPTMSTAPRTPCARWNRTAGVSAWCWT
ncbi:MCP four helix bundle domain-containing protein [Marinobacterium aestuariivivens]|uniref:MCP four helix bundle domain-containing protein n=1 Tax=Marinobacterium aestuariivivens TaxID=1698799 RepID=A0ABW2A974_9GAMM